MGIWEGLMEIGRNEGYYVWEMEKIDIKME